MRLRWFVRDDGERVLQFETMYGWQDVPEESEAEERKQRARWAEEHALREEKETRRRLEEVLPYRHRRTFKGFEST